MAATMPTTTKNVGVTTKGIRFPSKGKIITTKWETIGAIINHHQYTTNMSNWARTTYNTRWFGESRSNVQPTDDEDVAWSTASNCKHI